MEKMKKIAEIFYPKELKDVIADLRAKDDLNEEALGVLRSSPFVFLIVLGTSCFLMSVGAMSNVLLVFVVILIHLFLAYILIVIDIKSSLARMETYLYGDVRRGIIVAYHSFPQLPMKKIKVMDMVSKEKVFIGPFYQWNDEKNMPQKGTEITYYSRGKSTRCNMPDCIEIKKKYCLLKSMLREELNG